MDAPAAWEEESEGGWDDDEELDDLEEEDEFDLEPLAPRPAAGGGLGTRRAAADEHAAERLHHSAVRGRGGGRGRADGLILGAWLLTTRQLFFLTHSTLGIVIVHAFGGGLGTLLTSGDSRMKDKIRKLSTAGLAIVAWLASAVGTWFGTPATGPRCHRAATSPCTRANTC